MSDNNNIKLQLKNVFPSLSENELQVVCAAGTAVLYKKNTVVFKQNEIATKLVILLNGTACVKLNDGAQETIALFLNSGDTFGTHEASLQKKYSGTLISLSTSLFFSIGVQELQKLFTSPTIMMALLNITSKETEAFSYHAVEMVALPIKFRFIDALITLSKKFGKIQNNTLFIPIKRDQIGSYINASKASLSRIVNELEALNIITANRSGIQILNPEALKNPQALL